MSETINQGSYELPKHSQNCIQRRSQIAFLFWDKYCCQYIFISRLYFPLIFSLDFECGIWVVVALFSATLIDFDLSCWFCGSAVNKCSLKPCFPFVKCEETPGVGLGFRCGDCPPGYSGDGLRCDDVDEVNFIFSFFFCAWIIGEYSIHQMAAITKRYVLNLGIRIVLCATIQKLIFSLKNAWI